MITLIDGDILPYEIGAVTEGFHSPSRVLHKVDELVEHILSRTEATSHKLFLSEKGNYRINAACIKRYKGTRHADKPKWFSAIRDHIYKEWDAIAVTGREADDALAISQHAYLKEGTVSCIASRDKDLRIVPGMHYSWKCGEHQPERPLYDVSVIGEIAPKFDKKGYITAAKGVGLKFFYAQMLMGDSTDNIPGAPRKGPKVAIELLTELSTEPELYDAVRGAYLDAYKKQLDDNGHIAFVDWRGKRKYRSIDQMMREQAILLWMQAFKEDKWDREAYAERYSLWS
jgi:hypothetical protein